MLPNFLFLERGVFFPLWLFSLLFFDSRWRLKVLRPPFFFSQLSERRNDRLW